MGLGDSGVPERLFRECAEELAPRIPGIDAEAMATAMAWAGERYLSALEAHWAGEGNFRNVLKSVADVADAAENLIDAISKLGPNGCQLALDCENFVSFLSTPYCRWILRLAEFKEKIAPEIEDTPFEGRPNMTTLYQRVARYDLLLYCCSFLDPFKEPHEKAFLSLVPEMARAIHRILVEPDLPKNSQKFRNEWEGRSSGGHRTKRKFTHAKNFSPIKGDLG
jgi:hypothetical protein